MRVVFRWFLLFTVIAWGTPFISNTDRFKNIHGVGITLRIIAFGLLGFSDLPGNKVRTHEHPVSSFMYLTHQHPTIFQNVWFSYALGVAFFLSVLEANLLKESILSNTEEKKTTTNANKCRWATNVISAVYLFALVESASLLQTPISHHDYPLVWGVAILSASFIASGWEIFATLQ